jgi:hypothetical protein
MLGSDFDILILFFLETRDDIWRGHKVSARSRGAAVLPFERRGIAAVHENGVGMTGHEKIIKISKSGPNLCDPNLQFVRSEAHRDMAMR